MGSIGKDIRDCDRNRITRIDIINQLVRKFQCASYLEIGVADGECFNHIRCLNKESVDPESPRATHRMTSDEFFHTLHWLGRDGDHREFDLIFVDGLHLEAQVITDIDNSVKVLNKKRGVIVVHDCNPPTEQHGGEIPLVKNPRTGRVLWNGTVWRAWVGARKKYAEQFHSFTVDVDWGVGVMIPRSREWQPAKPVVNIPEGPEQFRNWEYFNLNRKRLLGLITLDEFVRSAS